MKYRNIFLVFFIIFSFSPHAEVPEAQQHEVDHLYGFMLNSGCKLERNDKTYLPDVAIGHMKDKQDYFADRITSTETFIKYAATKSEISGKYYMVHCPGKEVMKITDWLNDELKHYRMINSAE